MIAAISARVMSPFGSMIVLDLPYKSPLSTAALTASAYHALRSKSLKSVAFLAVLAADAETASDRQDATARSIARIRLCFMLKSSC